MARASSSRKTTAASKGAAKAAKKRAKPTTSAAARKREEAKREKAQAEQMELARDGLTSSELTIVRAETYLEVWSDWASGMTYPAVAAKHELSVRRVEQIVKDLRGSRLAAMTLDNPLATAQDLMLRWAHSVSQYAELADAITEQSQMHVKLGFLKRKDDALESMTTLMQELGHLPRNLGTLKILEDWQTLVDTLLEGMDELGIPIDVQRQLVERVEVRVEQKRGGRLQIAQGGVVDAVAA